MSNGASSYSSYISFVSSVVASSFRAASSHFITSGRTDGSGVATAAKTPVDKVCFTARSSAQGGVRGDLLSTSCGEGGDGRGTVHSIEPRITR